MIRVRISLRKGYAKVRSMDLVHDMLVAQMIAGGASPSDVIGEKSEPWTFAFLGHPFESRGQGGVAWSGREILFSTPSQKLAEIWRKGDASALSAAKAHSGEMIDFRESELREMICPIGDGDSTIGVVMLSPIALRAKSGSAKRWIDDPAEFERELSASEKLSKIAGREARVKIQLDSFATMRGARDGSMFAKRTVKIQNGRPSWALGFLCPAVLSGKPEDLRLAWHAGLGSMTRMGFGMFDKIGGLGGEQVDLGGGK